MLTEKIKQSESYQMFIKYSTVLILSKESKESDSEPARKQTSSKRVIKKKVSISTKDNIILEPDVALELAKSISLAEAAEEEAARQVHATHERIVTKSEPEPAKRRPSRKPAADIMQALKASKKSSISQPHTGGSSEGTGKEEITDTTKEEAEKTNEVKDNDKKAKLSPTRSSLFVSLGFGNQFLNLSFDKSTIRNLKDTVDAKINSLLDIKIHPEVSHIQSSSILIVPVLVIPELLILPSILETSTTASPIISTITPILQQQSTPIPTPPITTKALTFTIAVPKTPTITTVAFDVV
nr:hypothetical protein [Tanacetum cinerariifolium]